MGDEKGETDLEQVSLGLGEEGNPKTQYTLTESGTRLDVWTDGSTLHRDMPLLAGAETGIDSARQSTANTHFWSLGSKFDVRLDNMWVETGVEQKLSGIKRTKQPTSAQSTQTCGRRCAKDLRGSPKTVLRSDMSGLILVGQMWKQEFSLKNTDGNITGDGQAKEVQKEGEPPQQLMNEYVQRRHMIQRPQMAAVHILEWRTHNLNVAPEAKFDGSAGGGGEGARQAQAKFWNKCKKTEAMKQGTISAKPCRKLDELKEEERTHRRDVRCTGK